MIKTSNRFGFFDRDDQKKSIHKELNIKNTKRCLTNRFFWFLMKTTGYTSIQSVPLERVQLSKSTNHNKLTRRLSWLRSSYKIYQLFYRVFQKNYLKKRIKMLLWRLTCFFNHQETTMRPTQDVLRARKCYLRALKNYCQHEGMTQREAAKRLKATQPRMSDLWLLKTQLFSLDTLLQYCKKFKGQVTIKVSLPGVEAVRVKI